MWLRKIDTRGLYWYAAVILASFVILVVVSLVYGGARVADTATHGDDGPIKHVSHFPPAQFMRRIDATMCRFTVFDNDAGETIEDRISRCDEIPPSKTQGFWAKFSWGR